MIQNSPFVRMGLYILAVVAQIASFFMSASGSLSPWAQACQQTADFVGAMAGMTALANLSGSAKSGPEGTMGSQSK